MRILLAAAAVGLSSLLAGCATGILPQDQAPAAATVREYDRDFATVRSATQEAIRADLPVSFRSVEQWHGAYVFNFDLPPVSLVGGGGTIEVLPVDADTTRVTLHSPSGLMTGYGEQRLADLLFASLDRRLR